VLLPEDALKCGEEKEQGECSETGLPGGSRGRGLGRPGFDGGQLGRGAQVTEEGAPGGNTGLQRGQQCVSKVSQFLRPWREHCTKRFCSDSNAVGLPKLWGSSAQGGFVQNEGRPDFSAKGNRCTIWFCPNAALTFSVEASADSIVPR
jgi:hypothetical protein